MHSAMIHFEPCFTKADQGIFIKRTLKKTEKKVIINNKEITLYYMPVYKECPSKKAILRFITFLKEKNVEKVIFSDAAASLPCSKIIKEKFDNFQGSSVINYKLYDILRKYARDKKMDLSESTLIIGSENSEEIKNLILRLYRYVRKIKIYTKNSKNFSELTSFFLYEYGLFIEVIHQLEKKEKEIYLNLNNDMDADLCFSSEYCEIIFSNQLSQIKKYKNINQSMIEFLTDQIFDEVNKKNIKRFFEEFPSRIMKIKNND